MTSKKATSQTEPDDGTLGALAPALLRKLEDLVGLARMRPGKLHEYKSALQSADDLIAEGRGRKGAIVSPRVRVAPVEDLHPVDHEVRVGPIASGPYDEPPL